MSTSFTLPDRLKTAERAWTPVTLGQSDASVWRTEGNGELLFLKSAPLHALGEYAGEVERLRWLAGTAIPAPAALDAFEANDRSWLLMSALPGRDLTALTDDPAELCRVLADGLHRLHAIDPATCPFDRRLEAQLTDGAARAAAGLVDETDFDDARDGWSAGDVLAWLQANRPQTEDLVVAHGDASLPNIMADAAGFSGIIDCGRLGVSDRWQDLAIACRSIIFNCGEDHIAPFLAAYGAEWDAERYAYYCTLDELF